MESIPSLSSILIKSSPIMKIDRSKERAIQLSENGGAYTKLEDLGLNQEEQHLLKLFDYSFFEPVILVHIDVQKEKVVGMIEFEYDIRKKRAKRFVFEVQN